MKRWEYAIAVEEVNNWWTLWPQADSESLKEAADCLDKFQSDVTMLDYMSREGWELVTDVHLHDGLPRLIFKRRLK
jgi:hypothetical protein